jgi:hypothetical protein
VLLAVLAVIAVIGVLVVVFFIAYGDEQDSADADINLLVQSLGGRTLGIGSEVEERGFSDSVVHRVRYMDQDGHEHELLCTTRDGKLISHHEIGRFGNHPKIA